MPIDVFILGSGGHGKVVLEALMHTGRVARMFDADPAQVGKYVLGVRVELQPVAELLPAWGHLAIGDNFTRAHLLDSFGRYFAGWLTVIHPQSHIAMGATVSAGCFVAAGAVIGPDARIGCATIVNHGAVVDHDCDIGQCCHIAPNATLGGGVVIGDHVLVGSGAVVLPSITIGNGARIGSGAVVTCDIPPGITVVGIPARTVSR
ncbi:acetyltransferase [Stutzerimonas nitrititolerans]|uniref:acetyltransferase n=1 Tax=Stutzerimonas nitrititolerans TaxID=2482751 RepID=UPI0028AE873C|nr:acetyltransferase [Stutzerimonas nitrititolerans]